MDGLPRDGGPARSRTTAAAATAAGPGLGPMGFGGPGGPFGGRGPRARRGDVRAALLTLLAEEPRNGYQLMQEIERRSEGVWRPSPGSVYPALQQLEDEGLVRAEETDGRKLLPPHRRRPRGRRRGRRRGRAVGRGQRVGRLRRLGAVQRRAPGRHGDLPDRPGRHRRADSPRPARCSPTRAARSTASSPRKRSAPGGGMTGRWPPAPHAQRAGSSTAPFGSSQLGEHGAVVGARDRVDGDRADAARSSASTWSIVTGGGSRRPAATSPAGRRRPRGGVLVAAVEQAPQLGVVERGVEVAGQDPQRGCPGSRAGPRAGRRATPAT